ncbi:MAG: DUF4037 domain-containing protein [Oscillospiraceae bacterium]|nr:DUF4037 domain-containing protein [Oscillospiraceae bacterium]
MNGLKVAREYFEVHGKAMLEEQFADFLPLLAAGLFGGGSECGGFDDESSRDHDFEPGFCIFLPNEETLDRKTAFALERAYYKLPKEFMGLKRSLLSPVGGARHGVLRTGEFFESLVGSPDGVLTVERWLRLPSQALFEATNGEVYFDNFGEVSTIRERLSHFPEDVRRKRLAAQLLLMAQAGQYNYRRCLSHGETAAAQLAVGEFVQSTLSAAFLLSGRYMPYYKWSFRALHALPRLSELASPMEYLLTTPNDGEYADIKADIIEETAVQIIDELQRQELTKAICGDLEKHAYSVNDAIGDGEIRNLHILYTI